MSERKLKRTNLIRLPEVLKRVPLSKPSIYRKMKDGTFPQSVKLSVRAIAWTEHEIDAWIESKVTA